MTTFTKTVLGFTIRYTSDFAGVTRPVYLSPIVPWTYDLGEACLVSSTGAALKMFRDQNPYGNGTFELGVVTALTEPRWLARSGSGTFIKPDGTLWTNDAAQAHRFSSPSDAWDAARNGFVRLSLSLSQPHGASDSDTISFTVVEAGSKACSLTFTPVTL